MEREPATAALLIIGNEILSGRTHDKNIPYIAERLTGVGVNLREIRVVPDIEAEIVSAVQGLSARYAYLFTTGGIGPTHDDITAECVAKAVGRPLIRNKEAMRLLTAHYERLGVPFNEMRQRMAMTPEGAGLIPNPISAAPGFIIDNVHVMAGVPKIMQAMLDAVLPDLVGGPPMLAKTIMCNTGEGTVAAALAEIQARFEAVDIGSYPGQTATGFHTQLVLRSADPAALDAASDAVFQAVAAQGGAPHYL